MPKDSEEREYQRRNKSREITGNKNFKFCLPSVLEGGNWMGVMGMQEIKWKNKSEK